jgi:hypothetical protein
MKQSSDCLEAKQAMDKAVEFIDFLSRGVKLSKIRDKLKDTIDITPLLGKFQQLGFVKIVYNPSLDEEPLVQITEKGKQWAIEIIGE